MVPELTGLQFMVVSVLFKGAMSSNELRAELLRRGYTGNRVAFWRLMGRLTKGGIVTYASYENGADECEGKDNFDRQHRYEVSNLGMKLWKAARDFYLSFGPPPEDLDPVEVSEFVDCGPRERKEMADKKFADEFKGIFRKEWEKHFGREGFEQ